MGKTVPTITQTTQIANALMDHTNELGKSCRAIIRQLVSDNGWKLLSEDEFVEAVLARIPPRPLTSEQLRELCITTYCRQALHNLVTNQEWQLLSGVEREGRCLAIIRKLMANNRWRLLSETEFVEAVLARIPSKQPTDESLEQPEAEPLDVSLRKLCINTYCQKALYPACRGTQGRRRQELGFDELSDYLYRKACQSWAQDAPQTLEDAVQEALRLVYEKRDNCRNPGAFLSFAIQKLRDTVRKYRNQSPRGAISLDELQEHGDHLIYVEARSSQENRVEQAILYADLRREVAARIEAMKQQHSRAERQLTAIQLRHIEELSTGDIAIRLETDEKRVTELICLGLRKLRKDRRSLELAKEILAYSRQHQADREFLKLAEKLLKPS